MARLRLSTGILSPLQSDISINDTSAFSFGSLTGTPEFEKQFESPQSKQITEELDFNMCRNSSIPENATEFEMVMRDFKKKVNLNAEKEEKFKSTYEQLKQSVDELLHKKVPDLSILSPISKNEDFENIGKAKSVDFDKVEKTKEYVQNSQHEEEACLLPSAELQYWPHAVTPKDEKSSVEDDSTHKRERNYRQLKNTSNQKESERKLSISSKTNLSNELSSRKEEVTLKSHKTKSSKIRSSSTQTCESLLQATSITAVSEKGQNTISTTKAKSSSNVQNIENKGMSIEKSIQIAVSMELDKIRSLMLDQKLSLGKEMLKLQEVTRKQSEVVNYLLTVTEKLLEVNAKLRATHK